MSDNGLAFQAREQQLALFGGDTAFSDHAQDGRAVPFVCRRSFFLYMIMLVVPVGPLESRRHLPAYFLAQPAHLAPDTSHTMTEVIPWLAHAPAARCSRAKQPHVS